MDLLKILKKPEMRKIFGKKELVIIEKQLLGMKLKPSEKTRLSRDIRKKFEAVKELLQFANYFSLKHGKVTKEIIQEAKEAILETEHFPKIKRIYLFGSTAEKAHIFKSDIDIAVEFDDISLKEAISFRIKTRVPEKVDLQVYNVLPEKVKKEINEKGKIIYERKN
jgi:predicted nucleotidyltransferase